MCFKGHHQERQHKEWEKNLTDHVSYYGLVPRIYKKFLQLTTIKLDSPQGHKDGSTYANQSMCDTPHQQKKRQKPHDHLNRRRKSIKFNIIHDKNSYQSG